MIDGIKIDNLCLSADLLTNDRLTFLGKYDHQTGAVVEEGRDGLLVATCRGLTITAIRSQRTGRYRFELKGSIHTYHNSGLHNYNDFRAADLLAAVDDLVDTLRIDPFATRLNNVEFGVNVSLPFSAQKVLNALICHKGKPFLEGDKGPIYCQCKHAHYIIKIYNKGKQYDRSENLLRFEIKVVKMEYLTRQQIPLLTLADLLTVELFPLLGELLAGTFSEILFDEPEINASDLPKQRYRDLLREGRNPRYWQNDEVSKTPEYWKREKQLQRDEKRFRNLLNQYRPGRNWQSETAQLIRAKWQDLTTVTPDLIAAIENRRAHWLEIQKCPTLAGASIDEKNGITVEKCPTLTDPENSELSNFDPRSLKSMLDTSTFGPVSVSSLSLSSSSTVLLNDIDKDLGATLAVRYCPVTGINITHQRSNSRFLTSSSLQDLYRTNRATFDRLAAKYLSEKQAEGTLERRCYYIAHNIRNSHSNPVRNIRRLTTPKPGQTLMLFVEETIRPTERQRAVIDYRRGTRSEILIGVR